MTDEQKERLKQIRERVAAKYQNVPSGMSMMECPGCGCATFAAARNDIDFLLSLIDSQVAGKTATSYSSALKFVNEWLWNPPAFGSADRSTDQMLWHDPYKQDAAQMVIAASNRAATATRSRCVEKVKEKALKWQRASNDYHDSDGFKHCLIAKAAAANELAKDLEKVK